MWAEEVNNKILSALITVVKVPLCKALNPQIALVSCSVAKLGRSQVEKGANVNTKKDKKARVQEPSQRSLNK